MCVIHWGVAEAGVMMGVVTRKLEAAVPSGHLWVAESRAGVVEAGT